MLKRTKGLLLLTLLVITGLAGTLNDSSLSKKERKTATSLMKSTKMDVFNAIKGLSDAQLNFKPAPDRWSIKECVYHIAITEKNLWEVIENGMKAPANSEKRSEIRMTDEQLIKGVEDRTAKIKTKEVLEPKNTPYKSLEEALTDFKSSRADHIKYMKTSTEDLRNHVVQMPYGWFDCYQLCLLTAAHSNRHKQQIDEVKADPHFPKH
jgi:DinB superfamily